MNRLMIFIVAALAAASPSLSQDAEARVSAPTSVRADNPFARPIVEFARALQAQYAEFYRYCAMNPWDADGIMRRYVRYVRTYRQYWQAVTNYRQYEAQERAFGGVVLFQPPMPTAPPGMAIPQVMPQPASLAGARVTLTEFSADGQTAGTGVGLSASTDARGEFSIKRLSAGTRYEYQVTKAGFTTARGEFRFGSSSIRRRIVLEKENRGRIAGRVLGLQPQYADQVDSILRDSESGDLDRVMASPSDEAGAVAPVLRDFPLQIGKEGRYVIRSVQELRELTRDSYAGVPDVTGIDFSREMILAAAMGPTAGAHDIKITEVRRTADGLLVMVRETRPAPGQPVPEIGAQPTHAVVVAREDRPVRFRNVGSALPPADPRTIPLAGATVRVYAAGPEVAVCYGPDTRPEDMDPNASIKASIQGAAIKTDRTDARGRFSVEGLPAGEYILHVSRAGYDDVYRRVSSSQEALSLLMLPERLLTPPPAQDPAAASAAVTETTAESLNNPFGTE